MAGEELPLTIEYGKDIQASDNYKATFNEHIRRLLLLLIKEPYDGFDYGLVGLDALLDYYKDNEYLEDIKKYSAEYEEELKKIAKVSNTPHFKVNVAEAEKQLKFDFNVKLFRALIRLAGRATFLPIPSISIPAGGKNKDLKKEDVEVSVDEIEEIEKKVKEIMKNKELKKIDEMNEKIKEKRESNGASSTS